MRVLMNNRTLVSVSVHYIDKYAMRLYPQTIGSLIQTPLRIHGSIYAYMDPLIAIKI